ncbi:FxsA cytoplasmic membrane protein [Rubellimicrobium mesophilum DSM 19309]|uniref:FxsA cytoplasmic membrane protein n=1 Tax=Rubellimicrobium mesophilum DSM 19309 TaxID=442562 RepID=A0A017HJ44_9RHOB|nr:FxsA family protein [Rubellimicrobium mesophilum]EYD74163.1 FxsA cytoplasmic membrane protein [Rubellimicrobium mesophilum DSM 19309]
MARLLVAAYLLAEVASLVIVGNWIGVLGTLLLVVGAGLLGVALLRQQGSDALSAMRRSLDARRDPRPALLRGGFRFVAALLLILPGFLGDLVALALLVPAVQRLVGRTLAARTGARVATMRATEIYGVRPTSSGVPRDRVVEAEWEEVPPPKRPTHRPSGWTRH